MFLRSEKGNTIVYKISSEMCYVDNVLEHCKEDLSRFNITGDSSEFKVIVRELLRNAVRHGNQEIIGKTVVCSIEYLGARQFKVVVEDQGKGFNYGNIEINLPEDTGQIKRKGYVLINAFSKKVEFNKQGNCVSVYAKVKVGY